MQDLTSLTQQALAEVAGCGDLASLDEARVRWLGKKGTLTEQLKSLGDPETAALYAEAIARVFGLAEAAEKDAQDLADSDGQAERTGGRVQPFSRAKTRGQR